MRKAAVAGGIALMLVGGVWIFQGIGVLKGSFMTGETLWTWIGIGCVIAGVVMLLGRPRTRRQTH